MSKYGQFFSGPGSPNFAGWPSKQAGMPSGKGRYNGPSASFGLLPMDEMPAALLSLPQENQYTSNGWLIPDGPVPVTGSKYALSAVYHHHGAGMNSLDVRLRNGWFHEYGIIPFVWIYLLCRAPNPGEIFDQYIFNQFNCCISNPQ